MFNSGSVYSVNVVNQDYQPYSCLSVVCVVRGQIPKGDDLLVKEDLIKLKRCIYAAQVTAVSGDCIVSLHL